MEASPLRRCVGDVEAFFVRSWGRVPLLVPSDGPSETFDDLASLDDLDHMVSSLALRASSLRMVEDGKTLAPSAYTIRPGDRSRATEALISPALVYERFHEGATIVLEGIHRYWEPLADFSRELELALGHRLQVNAYITPSASQGFAVHRDDHDVFVLQVSGSKRWTVFDNAADDVVLIEEDLRPGDSLYVPEGFPHAAATTHEASAHLTVGILTHTAIDIVREVTKLASDEPVFQARLPRHDLGAEGALRETVERQIQEFRTWLDKLDVDELTRRVGRKLWTTSQPLLRNQLRQLTGLDRIDADTMVTRRRVAASHVSKHRDHVMLLLHDRELEFPLLASPALEHIAAQESIKVSELHGFLDPPSALVLVRRLVREGFLEVTA